MSDTIKIIAEVDREYYQIIKRDVENHLTDFYPFEIIGNGIPLDDVKAEIITERHNLADAKDWGRYYGLGIALEILDNIGKAESEE